MNKPLFRILVGHLVLAACGYAQTAPNSPIPPADKEAADKLLVLSPFTVTADEDTGYAATSTLAGSRIKTNIRDVGASIAIVTKDFMQDIGATDGESLLSSVGNVEVGGVLGNFSDVDLNNQSTNSTRNNPQGSQRIRGLVSATVTRNYFQTNVPFDSYNTSRVEVNRGPNSILFGLGSPGGVINNSTNLANMGRDGGEAEFRVDTQGGHRATFDYNKTLVADRLAVRLSILDEKINYQQQPAFEKDNRIYGAWDLTLFKNTKSRVLGRTTFRGSIEDGRTLRNPPDVVPPNDAFSSWFVGVGGQEELNNILRVPGATLGDIANGAVKAEWVLGAINAGLVQVPAGMTAAAYAAVEGQFIPKTTVNRISGAGLANSNNTITYFLFPAINFNSTAAGTQPGWSSAELAGIQGIMGRWRPAGKATQDIHWSSPATGGNGFRLNSLQDRNIFDYHNNLYQGTTNNVDTKFNVSEFVLEQPLFGGRAGVELAYNRQIRKQDRFNAFSSGNSKTIYLDLDQWLAPADSNNDGIADRTPNENVGRPVALWDDNQTTLERNTQETMRATVFGTLNTRDFFKGVFGKILGTHTLTGLYEDRQNDNSVRNNQRAWWADTGKYPGSVDISNGDNDNFRRIVKSQVYLGSSAVSLSSPGDLRIDGPISVQFPQVGDTFGIWYFDNAAAVKTGVKNNWRIIDTLINADVNRSTLTSKAVSMQSRMFWDNIVGMYAWRSDAQKNWRRLQAGPNNLERGPTGSMALRISDPGDNVTDGNFNEALLHLEDEPFASDKDSTVTWSVVGKYPENWLGKLPGGIHLSTHYYKAESFQPASGQVNILNQPLASPYGDTKEWGGTIELFKDRLSIRFNKFETRNAFARTNLGNQLTGNNGGIVGMIGFFLTRISEAESSGQPLFASASDLLLTPNTSPDNRQRKTGTDADLIGVTSYDQYYNAIINLLPPEVQAVYNYRIVRNSNGTIDVVSNPLTGSLQSTQDYVAKGMEIDVVGQITKSWSVSLNVAQQQTVTSNTGPVEIPLAFQIFERIKATSPTMPYGFFPVRDSPFQNETGAVGASRYASIIRNLQVEKAKDGQVTQEQREWRVNVVSRYDFLRGPLKGFSVGGALRYQSDIAAGYPTIFDADGNAVPDVANPWKGPAEMNGDAFIRYRKKLGNNIDWSIQLNARNLYRKNGNGDIPVTINPDGRVALIRIPNEQQFFVSNTFRF